MERSLLAPVSRDAIDLMSKLLRSKEYRLCSPEYAGNDGATNTKKSTSRSARQPDYRFLNSLPRSNHFVYPKDAKDIKAHPFFREIRWDTIHRERPPFIPNVQSDSIGEYFEAEKDLLSDMSDDSDSETGGETAAWCANDVGPDKAGTDSPFARWVALKTWDLDGANADVRKKVRKQPKRARDKILRDPYLCRTVMDVRKKRAFLGYTYRRPKLVVAGVTDGSHFHNRRKTPSFSTNSCMGRSGSSL